MAKEKILEHIIEIKEKQKYYDFYKKLPKIIFWNVAADIKGVPVTKYDSDVVMLSGFSTNLLENIFTLENYTPKDAMFEKLNVYLDMLNVDNS